MKKRIRRRRINSSVDMTPMLDVVFQLILFFLVSTTFAILPGISLNLPSSSTSEGTSSKGITISADKDGSLFFNEKPVNLQSLKNELMNFDSKETPKEKFPVSLEADSEVTNGRIVEIFDVLRQSGFSTINLRTQTKK